MEGSRLVDSQRPWTATTIDKRWRKSRSREARMCGDRETAASASGGREEQCVRLQYVAQPPPMGHSSTFRQAAESLAIVIMEVSGCCKSTIAALLVEALWAAASSKQMAIIPSQTKDSSWRLKARGEPVVSGKCSGYIQSKRKPVAPVGCESVETSPFLQYRARSQGYYVVYCVRVRFGGRKRPMPNCIICAKPKHQGITQLKFQRYKSLLLRRGLDASLADSGPLYEEKLTMTFF